MRGAIADKTEHDTSGVKLPYAWAQQRKRDDGADVDGHAWEDDAARSEAVEAAAEQRRDEAERDGGEPEAERDGFTAPAESGAERFNENREGIDEERTKAGHHAKAGGQDNAPAVIARVEFGEGGFRILRCGNGGGGGRHGCRALYKCNERRKGKTPPLKTKGAAPSGRKLPTTETAKTAPLKPKGAAPKSEGETREGIRKNYFP